MITYGSTTLTSYNTITKIEVYYYKSTSATSLSGGSWSTTKPTWENGKYIWQKIRTTYEGKLDNGQTFSESDPVNITGQQGATGTAAYSYKLNASDTTVTISKIGAYSVNKITFTATSKQGTGNVVPYAGQFKIETTINGTTWTTSYTSSGNESSKEFTIPIGIIAIRCSLYQANGTTTLLDIITIPILSDDRPIATKTYTGLIGSANDAANASFYFAKIHPDNYTTNYKVKMKVRVTAPEAYAETIDIQFGGYYSSFSSYDSYTTRTGGIGVYYINLYRATQAGISTNHKGHALGIGLRSSTNPTNTSYKRTVVIDILELDGCTIEMLDTAVKYASIDGTGSTNYYGLTEMSVGTAGQNATNNTNTHYTQYSNNVKAGTNGIKGYTLIMKDSENTWSCFYSGAYKGVNTEKPVYTGGFILGKILYSAGAGEQTSNSSLDTYYNYKSGVNTSTIYDAYPADLRYSTNCESTLTSQRPVYIVGTIENDGLFHLDVSQWYTQTEPTYADGKVYVYVGMAYSTYQVWLSTENPAYVYYDGEFILYDKAQTLQNINTLKNSLETQIDSKVETWCQKTNPANSWTAEERPNHTGDLWYYIGESTSTYKNNTTYQYNGETNVWSAYSANPDLFDKIDGKSAIYYGTTSSVISAEEGDYLVDSTDGSSYRWNNGAWVKVTDYKTAIDNIEIGGRNLLRNTSIIRTGVATQYGLWDILRPTYSSSYALDLDEGEYTLSFDWESSIELPASFYAWIGYGDINGQGRAEMPQPIPAIYTGKDSTSGHYVRTFIWANANDTYPYFACRPFRTSVEDALNDIEFIIKNAKLEKGNKATDWTPAPEDIEASIQEYAQSIQSQIDGMAEIHYGTVVPTLSNAPYTSWTDTETKDMHVDDLYYNTSTGYCYRFIKSGSTYSWTRIKDSDITAAATAASNANTAAGNAQTTANNANTLAGQKRRIFVAQPTPPYEVGDLWVEGSNGDIKKCKTARATGNYTASDWELASKYTDDTLANEANNKIDNLEVGGRNLFIDQNSIPGFISATEAISTQGSVVKEYTSDFIPVNVGDKYVLQAWVSEIANTTYQAWLAYMFYTDNTGASGTKVGSRVAKYGEQGETYLIYDNIIVPTNAKYIRVSYRKYNNGLIKLEKGTKPTDWTPAPEDTQAGIDTALAQSIWYATCSDAGATKSATITPTTTNFVLNVGTTVNVKFNNTNTGAVGSLTLNINNTGAKNIKYIYNKTLNSLPAADYITAGSTYLFVYDGTYWVIQNMNYNTNETNHILNNFSGKTGELGIWQTGLFMKDGNGTYQNICTDSSGNITRTNANTKKANPNGFEVGSSVYLSTGSTTYAANANITGAVYASYGAFDSRYSLNTTLTANCLTPYQPVYLVGTINNGLYYLNTIWWTQTPNDSTKVYVLIGGCYDSTTTNCRITLYEQNNWYKYVDGANGADGQLVDYTNRLAELAATTATSFIAVETDNHGIYVHPEDDMSTGWKIGDAIELFKGGLSYIKLWIENNIPKIRIGKSDQGHVLLDNDSVDIKNNNDVIASFGETTIIGKEETNNLRTKIAGGSFQIIDDDNSAIVNIGKVRATASQTQKIHFSFGTRYNTAYGNYSFVQGTSNAAVFDNQVALGRYGKYGTLLVFMSTISSSDPTFTRDISTYLSRGFTKEDIKITIPNYSDNYTWDLNNGVITITFLKEEQESWMMSVTINIRIGGYVALMIGNGSEDNRSNAVEMLWDGNIKMALDTNADEGTTDKNLYTAIATLGWENDVVTT